jgi:GNAT superfamily N-acetyltransferase
MLKIAVTDLPDEQRWSLQGQLVGQWATVLISTWREAHHAGDTRKNIVDLTEVASIDRNGEAVLAEIMNQGAEFLSGDVYTEHLLFPEVDGTDRPGLAISWPNTRFPFYNALFLTEQLADAQVLQGRVQEAAAYMGARPYGGLFVVCLDKLGGSAKESLGMILARAKFVQAIPMTGMAGDILPMEAPGHSALRFVRISNHSTIQAFAELNCVSYNIPIETSLSLMNEHTLWHEHAYGFVAYEGDKAVATATAIVNEGCLFLFLVATIPEARREGYGEAVVRHALQAAYDSTGIRGTVLHATDPGYPLYLRLGYHPTGKFMGCLLES